MMDPKLYRYLVRQNLKDLVGIRKQMKGMRPDRAAFLALLELMTKLQRALVELRRLRRDG